ncbi:hypothetical protein TKK_0001124 [Trichogramma kaykai]|uniref:Uncharacterized protein n=1 Tax=Trichogramma kaykai TaxID=54128 RepID=A0ABD2WTP2_9HYME
MQLLRCMCALSLMALLIAASDAAPNIVYAFNNNKISPNQQPPMLQSRNLLAPKIELRAGLTPANTARLPGGPAPSAAGGAGGGQQPQEDGVTREEMTSFKEVNGESIRTVVGSYAYQSPEGLAVSFKYSADENGNQAGFTIGKASAGGGGGGGGGGTRPSGGGGGSGSGSGGDRSYLPPN